MQIFDAPTQALLTAPDSNATVFAPPQAQLLRLYGGYQENLVTQTEVRSRFNILEVTMQTTRVVLFCSHCTLQPQQLRLQAQCMVAARRSLRQRQRCAWLLRARRGFFFAFFFASVLLSPFCAAALRALR